MFKKILIQTRFGNLLIMGIAQYLAFAAFGSVNLFSKILVIAATCAIALAGYIINDYFDKDIDAINKPGHNLFRNKNLRYFLWISYSSLSLLGLAIGFWYGRPLFLLNTYSIILLFVYSVFFKKVAFVGNIIIAFLQAAVFIPVIFYTDFLPVDFSKWSFEMLEFSHWFFIVLLFFAFFTGWLREWVKDMEDRDGDKAYKAKTAALVLSEKQNRMGIGILALLIALGVLAFTIKIHDNNFYKTGGVLNYYFLFLLLPLTIRTFIMLLKTQTNQDWGKLSTWIKIVMFAGVLSMAIS